MITSSLSSALSLWKQFWAWLVITIKSLIIGWFLIYAIGLIGLVFLWNLVPHSSGIISLTNVFALYFFMPLLLVPLAAVALRSRLLAGIAVLLVGLGCLVLGPSVVPTQPQSQAEPALHVVTFNQLFSNSDVASSLDILLAQQADIIAVQELSDTMVQQLNQVRHDYPYQVLHPDPGPAGMGLISRYPILHEEQIVSEQGFDVQRVVLDVDGRQVTLLNIHPVPPHIGMRIIETPLPSLRFYAPFYDTSSRDRTIEHILTLAADTQGPLIVAGDLNTTDREQIYQPVDALLRDAYRETEWGFGFTYPAGQHSRLRSLLKVRIDYIFINDELVPVATRVNCESQESDHCMVIADLAWQSGDDGGVAANQHTRDE